MLFLPLVEIFSQLIRPLTLTVRFATNLSAGHIIMFMFSYFRILSSTLAPFLGVVLCILTLMEIFIAFLQVYIFCTLLALYLEEAVPTSADLSLVNNSAQPIPISNNLRVVKL